MKFTIDERLRAEIDRYHLAFECERCAHFEPGSEQCAEGFPNAEHRADASRQTALLVFCKSFELA